jgi:hypothetical protein
MKLSLGNSFGDALMAILRFAALSEISMTVRRLRLLDESTYRLPAGKSQRRPKLHGRATSGEPTNVVLRMSRPLPCCPAGARWLSIDGHASIGFSLGKPELSERYLVGATFTW